MAISRFVITLLDALTEAIDDPFVDLNAIVSVLGDDAVAAVPSFLGLSIMMYLREEQVFVATLHQPNAKSSLLLSLRSDGGPPISDIVFYAADKRAFDSLAIGIRAAIGGNAVVVVDCHLPPSNEHIDSAVHIDLVEMSAIYQAVGVLMEREGLSPGAARIMLQAEADRSGTTLSEAARVVVNGLDRPTDPPV